MPRRKRTRLRELAWAHVYRVKWRLLVAAGCTLGFAAAELLKPWPIKFVIDHGLMSQPLPSALRFVAGTGEDQRLTLLVGAALGIVLIAVAGAVFSYCQVFISSSIGYRIVYALRRELFAHLQRLSLSFHNRARTGDLLTRVAADTNTLKDVFADAALRLASHVLTVAGMVVVLLFVDWRVSLVAIATLPLLCVSLLYLYRRTKTSVRTQRRREGKVASRMGEVLSAIPLVQAFARERYEDERLEVETTETLREGIRIARLEAAATRSSEIITAVGTAAAVLVGGLQVIRGAMLPGEFVLIIAYLGTMYKPIRRLAKLSTDLSKAMASADRLSEVLEVEPEIQDRPDAVDAGQLQGAIAFEGVTFDYGDGREVLRHVTFTASPGQRLALVGVSGAGKSTLVSLILRLYEAQEGRILVDGIDIRQYRRESLRRQIGIVPQRSILFGTTIRENIAYGRPDATADEIVDAARAANADEFVRELPHDYDTIIGERGATLSGGQQQRIAIARALIRDVPILILDEPMTGLDGESEAKVREALDRLMAGKTCLLITHDLPSIAGADLVLLLEDGRLIASGTHRALLSGSARYRELYERELQSRAGPVPAEPERVAGPPQRGPVALGVEAFPADAQFPHLAIAADARAMLRVFRERLAPVSGRTLRIESCRPVRFRCRHSTARCVLQYALQVVDANTERRWDQWVTGLMYARDGEAEGLWQDMQAEDPRSAIPDDWIAFEPVSFIPELAMAVQVFPYDRKIRHLRRVMDGGLRDLDAQLLARLPGGEWRVADHRIEPTRYRTELGAALRYTLLARDGRTARRATLRCYLKVYRNAHGAETFRLLRTLCDRSGNGHRPFTVPRPIAYSDDLHTLALEEAPGATLQRVLLRGRGADTAMRAVAGAVAAFNRVDPGIAARSPLADQLVDVRRAARLLHWACPDVRAEVRTVLAEVEGGLTEVMPTAIHRDLKPDHIFLAGDQVVFIDLDSVALGDPVRDPAHLFAHVVARVGLDGMSRDLARRSATVFLSEYAAGVSAPRRRRLPLHCAAALLEVASGFFVRQEPRWRAKAAAAVREARSVLTNGFG
jgi:ATP-binding cassette subfamily B protein/subfamily B ATP-binding cassette protein MsbA